MVASAVTTIAEFVGDSRSLLVVPSRPEVWRVLASSTSSAVGDDLIAAERYPELLEVRRRAVPLATEDLADRASIDRCVALIARHQQTLLIMPVFLAEGTAEPAVLRVSFDTAPRDSRVAFVLLVGHTLFHRLASLAADDVARQLGVPFYRSGPSDPTRLLDYLPLPAALLDAAGGVVHANQKGRRWLTAEGATSARVMRWSPEGCWRTLESPWEGMLQLAVGKSRVLGWSAAINEDRWLVLFDSHPEARRTDREERIRNALAAKVNELQETNVRLEHYAQLGTRFVSDAAHELKTPLAILRSYLESLASDLSDGLTPQQLEFVMAASEGAGRLHVLVEELLDLAALESGGAPLNLGPVRASEVLEAVTAELKALARLRGVALRGRSSCPRPIRADRERLGRVLRNLVENGIKYTSRGGRVLVSAEARGDKAMFVVEDDGVGIGPEALPLIFGEFTRGSTASGEPGAGLGLAIVRRLVLAMGGGVWAESTPGEGARFFVELPLWTGAA
jgi:signal transduction histidine kinase